MTPRENRIWLAALLEGEGWFTVKPAKENRRASLLVGIKMTDADVVLKAATLMEGSVNQRADGRSDKFTTCWECVVTGAKAEKVMKQVLPFMGQRRRAKIEAALQTPNLSHRRAKT